MFTDDASAVRARRSSPVPLLGLPTIRSMPAWIADQEQAGLPLPREILPGVTVDHRPVHTVIRSDKLPGRRHRIRIIPRCHLDASAATPEANASFSPSLRTGHCVLVKPCATPVRKHLSRPGLASHSHKSCESGRMNTHWAETRWQPTRLRQGQGRRQASVSASDNRASSASIPLSANTSTPWARNSAAVTPMPSCFLPRNVPS